MCIRDRHIILRGPIPQEHQEKFKQCFAPGVIEIEVDEQGDSQCVVKNPRKDTVSREVLRHPEFQDLVELTRIRDHFLCEFRHLYLTLFIESRNRVNVNASANARLVNVESVGQYKPEELVPEAIQILLAKITAVEEGLDKLFAVGE